MDELLAFEKRARVSAFSRELLDLPCMCTANDPEPSAEEKTWSGYCGESFRRKFALLTTASIDQHQALIASQTTQLEINTDEANIEEAATPILKTPPLGFPTGTSFASQNVYSKPSAFIRALIEALPDGETLTRDQMLFMAAFAFACDCAWEDENKPPTARRVHHMLLLGQGGSGKTHVVQKLVFVAVEFIWPSVSEQEPTLMVVASSNAQAKNISSQQKKARTIHNACCMRVQKMVNARLRSGKLGQGEGAGYRGN